MKLQYEVVSEVFISNCLIQAAKAKVKNRNVKIYFCKPRITENGHFQMFHFMWDDGKNSYDFSDFDDGGKRWYRSFLFKGYVRKFDNGFAKKYSEYRNQSQIFINYNFFKKIYNAVFERFIDTVRKIEWFWVLIIISIIIYVIEIVRSIEVWFGI